MLGLGFAHALALQRYKAKAKAGTNEPHCHSAIVRFLRRQYTVIS